MDLKNSWAHISHKATLNRALFLAPSSAMNEVVMNIQFTKTWICNEQKHVCTVDWPVNLLEQRGIWTFLYILKLTISKFLYGILQSFNRFWNPLKFPWSISAEHFRRNNNFSLNNNCYEISHQEGTRKFKTNNWWQYLSANHNKLTADVHPKPSSWNTAALASGATNCLEQE